MKMNEIQNPHQSSKIKSLGLDHQSLSKLILPKIILIGLERSLSEIDSPQFFYQSMN